MYWNHESFLYFLDKQYLVPHLCHFWKFENHPSSLVFQRQCRFYLKDLGKRHMFWVTSLRLILKRHSQDYLFARYMLPKNACALFCSKCTFIITKQISFKTVNIVKKKHFCILLRFNYLKVHFVQNWILSLFHQYIVLCSSGTAEWQQYLVKHYDLRFVGSESNSSQNLAFSICCTYQSLYCHAVVVCDNSTKKLTKNCCAK